MHMQTDRLSVIGNYSCEKLSTNGVCNSWKSAQPIRFKKHKNKSCIDIAIYL